MGPNLPCERLDFAGMIHADFKNAEFCRLRHTGERQRHTEMIVIGRNGCVSGALF